MKGSVWVPVPARFDKSKEDSTGSTSTGAARTEEICRERMVASGTKVVKCMFAERVRRYEMR
jgi:hypothetical protein